ncbi:response regulator [Methylorubrum aminovorans]
MSSVTTVLIVEDNYLLLEMLTRLCEREGMRVLAASSGEAALTALRDGGESIDWLFTDIGLPGLVDGWAVASAYRERHPQRPIVYTSSAAQIEGRTVRGSLYLRKPFETRAIVELASIMSARPDEGRSGIAG